MVLSCVVVFITTYVLILPAITLEQDEAAKQGGIDVPVQSVSDAGRGYEITADFDKAGLPEDTELTSEEIIGSDQDYDALYQDALQAVRDDSGGKTSDLAFAKFYDISLYSAGEPIEPDGPVDVTISYDNAPKARDADHVRIVHFAVDEETGEVTPEVLDAECVEAAVKGGKLTETTFEATSFSVYAIVYTVDFEYDVDGKKYAYSIEGGSKISLADLLLQLRVVKDDPDTEPEEVQLFLDDIDSVEFSSPDLVSVEQDEDGAWILTSLQPFDSEETLTVAMRNGDVFVVKVTDAQPAATNMNDFDGVNKFVIWGIGSDGKNYALTADGTTVEIDSNEIDYLGEEYQWTIEYGWEDGGSRYVIRPVSNTRNSLALNQGYQEPSNLVQSGRNGIHLYPPNTRHKNQQNNNYTSNNSGWILEGWGWTRLNLGNSSHAFEGNPEWCSDINITRQEEISQYTFTVQTEDIRKGAVEGTNQNGETQYTTKNFDTITNSASGTKTNLYSIQADPISSGRYLFDYWDLNGTRLAFSNVIGAGQLTIPTNGSVLTAHFKNNPDYVVPDEEKEGHSIDKEALNTWLAELKTRPMPFEPGDCDKTAELYDYENRIYRVDLTAQSSLTSFVGDIDLGFMLDVSGSMKFPSKLEPVDGLESVDINHINDNSANQEWLDKGPEWNRNNYYIISDKGSTATVYEIRWGNWIYNAFGNTRAGWGYKDASKDDGSMRLIQNGSVWSGGETGESYPIYKDGDPGKKRLDYLEDSIDNTISELNVILDALSVASDPADEPQVKMAWNTFAKPLMSTHHAFSSVVGLTVRPDYTTSGGTSIDIALLDAAGKKRSDDDGNANHLVYDWNSSITYSNTSGFEWEDDAVKFAVLITDGAPQRNGRDIDKQLVKDASTFLKNGKDGEAGTDDDVKLLTVGLSMGDVKKGSVLLYDIADPDANGTPLFYKADYGDELKYVLYEMLKQAMTDAIVQSDITDTINEAFYPVDKVTGVPLANNNVIDLNGVKIGNSVSDLTPEQRQAGYGTIHQSGETYTVTWENQDVYGKQAGGWHGTIYEKAREDFLGGNAVRTNDPGHNAVVQAKSYKVNPEDTPIPLKDSILNGNGRVELNTPRVNVNELAIPEDQTKWTVYLGTKVEDLAEHLKKMYENIPVKQVITSGEDTNGDGLKDKVVGNKDTGYYYTLKESASDKREDEVTGAQQNLHLKDLIKKINGGNDINWNRLIALSDEEGDDNTGLVFPYTLYGQDNPGKITIKLVKDHALNNHVTTETGESVETYTLSVLFEPSYEHLPVGIGGDGSWPYHTGDFGLCDYGNAAGLEDRKYEHVIDVFAKKLQIQKADQEQNTITDSEATFILYRKATEADMGDSEIEKVSITGLSGQYVVVQTLTTINGVVSTDVLPLLENNEPYYLVETVAPNGYNRLTEPLQVKIDMDGHNTWTKKTDGSTSQVKPNPYVVSNWLQEATIKITDSFENETGSVVFVLPQGEYERYNSNNDTTDASVTYKIINSSGAALPNSGGPGTTWIYLIGSLLLLGCGVVLVARRRMRI